MPRKYLKYSLFVIELFLYTIHCHVERSDFESFDSEDIQRRTDNALGREWQFEGLPIDDTPHRRRIEAEKTTTTSTTTSTTTTTTTTEPPTTKIDFRYRRIYGSDETASIANFPFMAALLVNDKLWCGAAIIAADRVLTAAHCLQLQYNNRFFREYVKMLTVRVGSQNATHGGELMKVTEISFHPNYKPQTLNFNFAILKLHKNLTLDNDRYINKIDYSRTRTVPVDYKNITFLGWGSTDGTDEGGRILLQKVDLPVYDLADCREVYGRDLVTQANFCAGFISEARNVCNHDAGGPAILDGLLIGILSFSNKRCDQPDKPAVFSNVGVASDWIESVGRVKPARRFRTN